MAELEIFDALIPVIDALESLRVSYYVTGSLASSAHGIARATLDIDLVAALAPQHVSPLVTQLESDYYVDRERVSKAVESRSSFNLIHLVTMLKVDVFVPKSRAFDRAAMSRVQAAVLAEGLEREKFFLASPEDLILSKLEWYRTGGEVSDRQWQDVLGILRVQEEKLDWDYLKKWADELKVADLLERANKVSAGKAKE